MVPRHAAATESVERFECCGDTWVRTKDPVQVTRAWCQRDGAPLWLQRTSSASDRPRCPTCRDELGADVAVRQFAGRDWMWWHPHDPVPQWELPADPITGDFSAPHWSVSTIQTTWMDIAENSVDWQHFPTLHAPAPVPLVIEDRWDDHIRVIKSLQRMPGLDADSLTEVRSVAYGPGVLVSSLRVVDAVDAVVVASVVPQREHKVAMHVGLATRVASGSGDVGADTHARALDARSLVAARRALQRAMRVQVEQDAAIWNHKIWLPDPRLAAGEQAITQVRRDLERFRANTPGRPTMLQV